MNKHEVLQRIARYLMLHSSFTDKIGLFDGKMGVIPVSYTHLRAHETDS